MSVDGNRVTFSAFYANHASPTRSRIANMFVFRVQQNSVSPVICIPRTNAGNAHRNVDVCACARIVTDFVVSDQWRCVMSTQLIVNHHLLLSKINLLSLLAYNG